MMEKAQLFAGGRSPGHHGGFPTVYPELGDSEKTESNLSSMSLGNVGFD